MVYARWSEDRPEGLVLGVERIEYGPPIYGWGEPATRIAEILPHFTGEEFTPEGFQTPHHMGVWDILDHRESLKFLKHWPKPARIEAGRFLRQMWRARRALKARGLLI